MLSTHDLEDMMRQDPVTSSCFLGVFASNKLQDSQLPKRSDRQHGPQQQTGSTLGGHVFGRGQGGIL